MTRTFTKVAAAATFAVASFATTAQAQDVFQFSVTNGAVRVRTGGPTNTDPLFIDFLSGVGAPGTPGVPPATVIDYGRPGVVSAASGNDGVFAPLVAGTNGGIEDLQIEGGGAPINVFSNFGATNANFIQIGGFTFTLGPVAAPQDPGATGITFGPIALEPINNGRNTSASLALQGWFFTPTGLRGRYEGELTATFRGSPAEVLAAANSNTLTQVGFAGTFFGTVVPEPSTYALMASGVMMLGAFARRRRQEA